MASHPLPNNHQDHVLCSLLLLCLVSLLIPTYCPSCLLFSVKNTYRAQIIRCFPWHRTVGSARSDRCAAASSEVPEPAFPRLRVKATRENARFRWWGFGVGETSSGREEFRGTSWEVDRSEGRQIGKVQKRERTRHWL